MLIISIEHSKDISYYVHAASNDVLVTDIIPVLTTI